MFIYFLPLIVTTSNQKFCLKKSLEYYEINLTKQQNLVNKKVSFFIVFKAFLKLFFIISTDLQHEN